MCRIFGVITKNNQNENFLDWIKSSDTLLSNGGPDDSGFVHNDKPSFIFGHRRLSILDVTSAGHQPMCDVNDTLVTTYNGEIYNFAEIKTTLILLGYQFKNNTDTEVILYAYKEWEELSFQKFNGMFAFGLMDKQKQVFYLVRDRMGIKPVYYYAKNNVIAFASEVKVFYNFPIPIPENPDWKIYFLAFGHMPEPFSTLQDVLMLEKGHFLKYDYQTDKISTTKYYADCQKNTIHSKNDAEQLLKITFEQTVNRHLISDVPTGVFLSGGIDSSLIALVASQQTKHINTISLNFDNENFNERHYQKIIVDKIKSTHHDITISSKTFIDNLDQIIEGYDQPSVDGVNTWFVSKYSKELGLKVVLSGIGADELLGGYPSFKKNRSLEIIQLLPTMVFQYFRNFDQFKLKKIEYLGIQDKLSKYLINRSNFSPSVISKILGVDEKTVYEKLQRFYFSQITREFDAFEDAAWFETNLYMQNQLLKDGDNLSMQHGVELRIPFLDVELVNLIAAIDIKIKGTQSSQKSLMVNPFKDLLPPAIYNRPKKGFSFPFHQWLLHPDVLRLVGQHKNIALLKDKFKQGNMEWSRLWSLVMLESFQSKLN